MMQRPFFFSHTLKSLSVFAEKRYDPHSQRLKGCVKSLLPFSFSSTSLIISLLGVVCLLVDYLLNTADFDYCVF